MNFSNDKYNYQLTDHLGNVRAVISKLKFMETATMEPENLWLEQDAFANVAETAWGSEGPLDHTTPEPTGYVSYLNGAQGQLVGPVKSLRVTEGDRVEMEVFANYYEATSTGNLVGSMAGLLTGPLNLAPTGENTQILSAIDNALTGVALVPGNGDNTPKAYLQYLFVDDNFEYAQPAGVTPYVKMTSAAQVQFNPGIVAAHEKLSLAFDVPEDGYMYIYVATESAEDIDIFFDDFTVKHLGVDIIQRTDYYPFGLVLKTYMKEDGEDYRFGYQGQFSEEDEESGWNAFELRMYDPIIGRWLQNDPYGQYASPYLGMGNDPVNRVDPDGGLDEFRRLADGSLELLKATGDNFHLIHELNGTITEVGLDFFRLPGITITAKAPLIKREVPAWMLTKVVDIQLKADLQLEVNAGILDYSDRGLIGGTKDQFSVQLFKGNITATHDISTQENSITAQNDFIGKDRQFKFKQGFSVETGTADFKSSVNYVFDSTKPQLKVEGVSIGAGIPFVEGKLTLNSDRIHNLRLGLQEDVAGSFFGLGGKLGGFVGVNIKTLK